jgi:pyrroloquinoline quinone biosynthesis protein D
MLNEDVNQKLTLEVVPEIASSHRFQWEEVQDCHVILYPEGMVKLGNSSAEILKLCDGQNDVSTIISTLQQQYPDAKLDNDVMKFLEVAHENGWIQYK